MVAILYAAMQRIFRLALTAVTFLTALGAPSLRAAAPAPPATVAILYFDYEGKTPGLEVLRKGLAQMLITDLSSSPAFQIVERERLEALLAEQKLAATGKLDPATATRVGRLLGARYMVMGGYFDLNDALRVDARLVEVETGRIVGTSGTTGKPGDVMAAEQKTARDLERLLSGLATRAEAGAAKEPAAARPPAVKPPARLSTGTAVLYAKALDDIDRGDRAAAKEKLVQVVKDQPDFQLASLDLNRLQPI
jgi:curli biogenesis system outer membrane secretion channel CsgG